MSSKTITTKVDSKGRITIPKKVRENVGISEGDIFFIDFNSGSINLTKAVEDPIAKLKEYALKEYEQGNTISLEEYCKREGLNYE